MKQKILKIILRTLRGVGLVVVSVYLIVNLAGVWLQNLVMFPIPRVWEEFLRDEFILRTTDGVEIKALWLENQNARYTILFSHGNGEDLDTIEPFLRELRGWGFQIMAYDYRGYGRSQGRPSERGLEKDILATYVWLTQEKQIAPEKIIVFGRSIGGGPSVWLASQKPVAGLVLESTFTSAYEVMLPSLPYYRNPFPNEKRLRTLRVPVLFIHGSADLLIRPWHARKNFASTKAPKQLVWIEGAGHNDVLRTDPEKYRSALTQFADSL